MGILWAISWGAGGVALGVTSLVTPFLPWERFFEIYDAPLPTLAIPGFIAGLLFSVVLNLAARRRRLADLSTRQFALWGAIGGLMLSVLPDLMFAMHWIYGAEGAPALWQLTKFIATPLVILGSATASVTFQIAKRIPVPIPLEGHREMLELIHELAPFSRDRSR